MGKKILDWLLNNKTTDQTIAKNTFWLFAGQVGSRLLRAGIVIYSARLLGASSWGAFSYAIGIAAFLTIFSDIGINALITKEASRNPELKNRYLSTALFIKLTLLAVFITVVAITAPYLSNIAEAGALIPIIIFVFAFDTLRDLGSALSRAMEKMEIEAGINILTNFLITALGFILLAIRPTSQSLAIAYALGSGLGLIAIFFALRKHFSGLLKNFTKSLIRPILVTAWPFGLMGLMGVVMLNTDIVMLGWLVSPEQIGFYSAAQKPIQLLYVLPALLASSIFPVMSRLAKTDKAAMRKLLKKYLKIAMIAAAPVAIFGFLLAVPIINILFGAAYLPAVAAFRILVLSVLVVYPSTLIGNAIFAYDHHREFIKYTLTAIIGNIALNATLIPSLGIEGAALSTLFTQLITNVLIWRKLKTVTTP